MYDLTYSQTVYDRGKCSVSTEVQQFSNRIIFESNESFLSNLPSENFLICDRKNLIGSTKTTKVYSGKLKNRYGTEEEVAIKELKNSDSFDKMPFLKIWIDLKHVNIIELKGYCPNEENKSPLIIMEYGKGGLLKSFLKNRKDYLPLDIIIKWGLQIADGMIAIHEKDVPHRDLASGNIVMTNSDDSLEAMEEIILKIIDINDQDAYGTPLNMAPEAFNGKEFITKKSDVYSFGSLLWELKTCLDGEIEIFNGLKLKAVDNPFSLGFYKSKKVTFKIPEFEQDIDSLEYKSEQALNLLIQKCWIYEPENRPDFNVIMQELSKIQSVLIEEEEEEDEVEKGEKEEELKGRCSYYEISHDEKIEQDDQDSDNEINQDSNFKAEDATIPAFF